MKKSISIYSLIVIVLLMTISGCASVESKFADAKRTDTIYAFGQFVREHPDSPLATEAKRRIIELSYDKAKAQDNIEAYQSFLSEYPHSIYAAEAKEKILIIKESEAEFHNIAKNIGELGNFIKRFPIGPAFRKARREIENIMIAQIKAQDIGNRVRILTIQSEESGYVSRWTISEVPSDPEVWDLEIEGPYILERIPKPEPFDRSPFQVRGMQFKGEQPEGKVGKARVGIRPGLGLNPIFPSGEGTILRFKGKITFKEITFIGQENSPLTFVLLKDLGFVYVKGEGEVALKDGTVIKLPSQR